MSVSQPEIGKVYRTVAGDVPRIVDRIEDGVVYVKAPGSTVTWPVKNFWRRYYQFREAYR